MRATKQQVAAAADIARTGAEDEAGSTAAGSDAGGRVFAGTLPWASPEQVVGGGAAMVLAYDYPLATHGIDAFISAGGLRMADLDEAARPDRFW